MNPSSWLDKWVVSWTQAFTVVMLPGECLRVKEDMVLFAGNTMWSISERVRSVREDALYKLTLSIPLFVVWIKHNVIRCWQWRCVISEQWELLVWWWYSLPYFHWRSQSVAGFSTPGRNVTARRTKLIHRLKLSAVHARNHWLVRRSGPQNLDGPPSFT